MSAKKVFISYSHDSPEHSDRVLQFSNTLRSHGIDVELDRYQVRPPKGWPHWCEEQLRPENSDFVLMVCTEIYLKRIQDKVRADEGRGVFWEGGIIYDYIYDDKGSPRFIPILFAEGKTDFIPPPVRNHTRYKIKAFDLTDEGYRDLYRELTGQLLVTKPPLGQPVDLRGFAPNVMPLETRPVKTDFPPTTIPNPQVDISRIIKYAPAELIGREAETKLLTEAWDKVIGGEKGRAHILTFVALGGEGKTSLVAKWTAELAHQDWPGCDAAFAWSFYSQGTREQLAASSDLFLKEALTFFGDDADKQFAASSAGSFEKGQRLARIVGEWRNLLMLDGLEPLQYSPAATAFEPGELKDQGVAKLLKDLAASNRGLCIVTTRIELPDLQAFKGGAVSEIHLKRLSRDAGVHLLKLMGVKGSEIRNLPLRKGDAKSEKVNEFEKLVEDVKGHALSLTLLGGFLKRAFHGDIRQRDRVKFEKADEKMDGGHAFRIMAAYEQWLLRDGGDEGRREVTVMRLMGLFDRPADAGCLAALRSETIPGLTEPLAGLDDDDWEYCLSGLEIAKLATVNREASGALISLDSHPLIREYFAKQLREKNAEASRAAHRGLFEHLCKTTHEGDEPALEDLQPLYQAVAHGCLAGEHRGAFRVYWDRIQKEEQGYSHRRLGALGQELEALNCFFDMGGSPPRRGRVLRLQPSENLELEQQARVCGMRGARLRSLGRTREAVDSLKQSVELYEIVCREDPLMKRWLAQRLRHLAETLQPWGDLLEAEVYARKSVKVAESSGDGYQLFTSLCTLGAVLHHQGQTDLARQEFERAQKALQDTALGMNVLYSLWGFRFNELLLDLKEFETVKANVRKTTSSWNRELPQNDPEKGLDFIGQALEQLSEAKAKLGLCEQQNRTPRKQLLRDFNRIDDAIRRAGRHDFQPYGMLACVSCLRLMPKLSDTEQTITAEQKLTEAWDLALRERMRVFQAECWLESARLFLARNPEGSFPACVSGLLPSEYQENAGETMSKIRNFISKTYGRRTREFEALKRQIANRGKGSYQT